MWVSRIRYSPLGNPTEFKIWENEEQKQVCASTDAACQRRGRTSGRRLHGQVLQRRACDWQLSFNHPGYRMKGPTLTWIGEHAWDREEQTRGCSLQYHSNDFSYFCGNYSACFINDQILLDLLDWTTACVCSEVPEAMFVKAQAASNCKEGLQSKGKKKIKKNCNMSFQTRCHRHTAKYQEFLQ